MIGVKSKTQKRVGIYFLTVL